MEIQNKEHECSLTRALEYVAREVEMQHGIATVTVELKTITF